MARDSAIEWTHHTWNPWWGCTRVSPGCEHCYAEAFDRRVGGAHWGIKAERRFFGQKHWDEPLKWDRAAKVAGERHRVFCASMADVFEDRPELEEPRHDLLTLILSTPNLDWLLLTKRPQNLAAMLPWPGYYAEPFRNVWRKDTAMIEIDQERLAELERIHLDEGSHEGGIDEGACIMEMVSYLAHEEWSDSPKCASSVISAFLRSWNDALNDETRQRLKPYAARVIGTAASDAVELCRSRMAFDWFVRVSTPAWLELANLNESATALRALPEICTASDVEAAMPLLEKAQREADAAWAAAWAAAGDAAWAAAGAAAWAAAGDAARAAARAAAGDAARAAAGDAAWDAAQAAAGDAAWAAAGDAARSRLEETKKRLQESAFKLLDRMIACTEAA